MSVNNRLQAAMRAYANTPWCEDYFREAMQAALEAVDDYDVDQARAVYRRVEMHDVTEDAYGALHLADGRGDD